MSLSRTVEYERDERHPDDVRVMLAHAEARIAALLRERERLRAEVQFLIRGGHVTG